MDPLPARVDVAVIGGGLAGLATAWGLAERGHGDVVVVERDEHLAGHASARNAAMCRALAEDDAWTAWTAPGAALLVRPPAGLAAAPLCDRRGAVLATRDPAVAEALAARAARFEVACRPIDAAEIAARWPGLAVAGSGVLFPDDGVVDLAGLVAGLARAARRAGARLVTGAGVEGVTVRGARVTVATARGPLDAARVVIAAGAWAGEVGTLAGVDDAYQSRRRHIFALAGAPPRPDVPIVWNVDDDEWYLRPAGPEVWASACDGDAVAPGVVDARREAEAELRACVPAPFDRARVARAWACQRTFAAGGAPVVGRDAGRPWLYRVTGLGGHGVTACTAIGRAAAAALLDDA